VTPSGKTLSELAAYVGGRVIGDGGVVVTRVAAIDEAGPGDITFLANPRYAKFLRSSKASAVIVIPGTVRGQPEGTEQNFLEVSDPYVAFAKILQLLTPARRHDQLVSPSAHVEPGAVLGDDVAIFPQVFVGKNTKIGSRSVLFPGVVLAEGAEIGEDCVLHPHVVVCEHCRIGQRVVLHAGVVIGSDGFGYAGEGSQRVKIPQVGIVEVQDDVEIGANTTIDRATLGRTVIGRGTKIDNLVQIAHNVVIGENSIIAAQVGIAGSTQVGKDVTLGGQVGIVNHVSIGDGAKIGPQSGIPRPVPSGAVLSGGIEAAPHQEWLKVMTLLPQLPKLWNAVRRLEKTLAQLTAGGGKGR
jgi:UDP-3-O-[3-hydroxymyristoyl] glucosamine N-acyltransferase